MKRITVLTTAIVAGSLLMAGGAMAQAQPGRMDGTGIQQRQQQQQQMRQPMGQPRAQQQVKGVEDLKNFSLRDQQGQNIGAIEEVLVDLQQGQIGYVVVETQAGQSHVIPWNALQADAQQQTLTLQLSADRFRQAPTGDAQMVQDMEQARQIHQFYGVSPYWEEETRPMIDQRMQRQREQMQERSPVQERMDRIEQQPMQQQQQR